MDDLMNRLIQLAKERYGNISPCANKKSLRECFTILDNTLVLWFNTSNRSTNTISCLLDDSNQTG